jgi:uncharacterized surface protein with fasciclin (FAS1) repeats
MNHNFSNSINIPAKLSFVILLTAGMVFSFCKQEAQVWEKKSQEMPAGDYIASNPDQFSEFEKLMVTTGMDAMLNVRGPYTVFLPNNDAMFAYYKFKNVNSLADLSDSFKDVLIRNHIVGSEIPTDEIGLGALSETNAIGDYLVTEFDGSDIIISKGSKIIKRNIRTANGFIHVVNKVLDPVTKDIYSVISSDPSYKIFTEGLDLTGIKDTLKIISFPYGKTVARTRFTILAVADTIYHRYGINSVGDLIKWCGASPDSLTFMNNPFYRYIEYHCLNGSFFLSDLNTGLYPILSRDNNLMFTIDTDYKINLDNKTKKYTGFNIPASNTPAKNGALHSVNDILPVIQPEPAVVIFETTDFFDIKQGDYYGRYYQRFFDGEKTFAKIKWEGDYMLYYYKGIQAENMNYDCLSMNGWWSVSVTFPKVMKGKYKISIYQPGWGDVTNCVAYVDGVGTPFNYAGPYGKTGGSGGLQQIAEVDFPTTAEHTITLRNTVNGMLFWDYVRFDPIK